MYIYAHIYKQKLDSACQFVLNKGAKYKGEKMNDKWWLKAALLLFVGLNQAPVQNVFLRFPSAVPVGGYKTYIKAFLIFQ